LNIGTFSAVPIAHMNYPLCGWILPSEKHEEAFMGTLVCFILPAMIIGAVIALVALFPPFKILAQLFAGFRLALAFTLGLISFLTYFGIDTYTSATAAYSFGTLRYECQSCDFIGYYPTEEEEENKDAIILEYWARNILLPPFQTPCNTGNLVACRLADFQMQHKYRDSPSWDDFLFHFSNSYFATLSAVACVAYYTREKPSHRRKRKTILGVRGSSAARIDHSQTQSPSG
jgi:hypothetical protein